jgi:hypothetical protein
MDLAWLDPLVQQRQEWRTRNFPMSDDRKECHSVLGVIEEVGELAHHHLKEAQGIRGTAEEHQAGARDAIGDIMVYLFGPIAVHGLPRQGFVGYYQVDPEADTEGYIAVMARAAGRLHSTYTRWIRSNYRAALSSMCSRQNAVIVSHARAYSEERGWDFREIVEGTWAHVSQRDWVTDPQRGVSATPAIQAEEQA